jgi:hypothetical protein
LSVSYSSLIAVFCSRAPAVSGKDKPNYRPQEEGWPEANTSLGLLCFHARHGSIEHGEKSLLGRRALEVREEEMGARMTEAP